MVYKIKMTKQAQFPVIIEGTFEGGRSSFPRDSVPRGGATSRATFLIKGDTTENPVEQMPHWQVEVQNTYGPNCPVRGDN